MSVEFSRKQTLGCVLGCLLGDSASEEAKVAAWAKTLVDPGGNSGAGLSGSHWDQSFHASCTHREVGRGSCIQLTAVPGEGHSRESGHQPCCRWGPGLRPGGLRLPQCVPHFSLCVVFCSFAATHPGVALVLFIGFEIFASPFGEFIFSIESDWTVLAIVFSNIYSPPASQFPQSGILVTAGRAFSFCCLTWGLFSIVSISSSRWACFCVLHLEFSAAFHLCLDKLLILEQF